MAKISKRLIGKHNKAVEILEKEELNWADVDDVFDDYHEGVGKSNNMISAHFTPPQLANSICQMVRNQGCFIDLCAGIGRLAYQLLRSDQMGRLEGDTEIFGICIERCQDYYEVGKKLLPQFHWICGDIFDQEVIDEIKSLMEGKRFSIVSNPPYGKMVKTDTKKLLKYNGGTFEYKAIELGALLGADGGTFLIPQQSCPFRLTGNHPSGVYNENYKSKEYLKFVEKTGLEIEANSGFDTRIFDGEQDWRDVSIVTEIAIVDYEELDYKPIGTKEEEKEIERGITITHVNEQLSLF